MSRKFKRGLKKVLVALHLLRQDFDDGRKNWKLKGFRFDR